MAIGAALAKKIQSKAGKVYCLIGDGESNEGTIWESFLLAKNLKLDNVVCIIDNNKSQSRSLPVDNLQDKIASFGWDVVTVDGHNVEKLKSTLSSNKQLPYCVICNTTKGKGIEDMEQNTFAWHHGPPNKIQYDKFIEELDNA